MNKQQNLILISPLKGTAHGAKVIFREIYKCFQERYNITIVDTAQAQDSEDYGSFRFSKIIDSIKIFVKVWSVANVGQNILMNMTPHGFAFWRDLFILFILKSKQANITIHIHANGLEKKYNWLTRKILQEVKTIVINSDQQNKLTHSSKIYLLENSLPDFKHWNFQEILSRRKSNRLLFISNLSTQKGFYRLLKISKELEKHFPGIEIHAYGNILEKDIHAKLKKLSKASALKYMGVVNDMTEKSIVYSEATSLLFLSDKNYEVFPLVYIEALMHGLPIISTPQHVTKSVIKDNGILIDSEADSPLLLPFIATISTERSSLIQYSENSHSLYTNYYSFASYLQRLEGIITQ